SRISVNRLRMIDVASASKPSTEPIHAINRIGMGSKVIGLGHAYTLCEVGARADGSEVRCAV
ncbi:MAG: hypothetical protein ACI86S_002355, partial [Paracoccaceae bacterium]